MPNIHLDDPKEFDLVQGLLLHTAQNGHRPAYKCIFVNSSTVFAVNGQTAMVVPRQHLPSFRDTIFDQEMALMPTSKLTKKDKMFNFEFKRHEAPNIEWTAKVFEAKPAETIFAVDAKNLQRIANASNGPLKIELVSPKHIFRASNADGSAVFYSMPWEVW